MDRLSLSAAGGLAAEQAALHWQQKKAGRAQEQGAPALPSPRPALPEDPATVSPVAADLGRGISKLAPAQAREVLGQLCQELSQTPAWRLAEIEPVSERTLIPAAYV